MTGPFGRRNKIFLSQEFPPPKYLKQEQHCNTVWGQRAWKQIFTRKHHVPTVRGGGVCGCRQRSDRLASRTSGIVKRRRQLKNVSLMGFMHQTIFRLATKRNRQKVLLHLKNFKNFLVKQKFSRKYFWSYVFVLFYFRFIFILGRKSSPGMCFRTNETKKHHFPHCPKLSPRIGCWFKVMDGAILTFIHFLTFRTFPLIPIHPEYCSRVKMFADSNWIWT